MTCNPHSIRAFDPDFDSALEAGYERWLLDAFMVKEVVAVDKVYRM